MVSITGTTSRRRSVGVLLGESSHSNQNTPSRLTDCVLLRRQVKANAQSDYSAMNSASASSDKEIIHHG